MEGRFGSIGDKIKPGQLPISLPRHGTAGWWTWSVKLNLLYGMSRLGLIAGVETSAFAAAEDRMSDFLGMARISVVFGKYSGCNYAVNTT